MTKKVALIDGDSLLYQVACATEVALDWEDGEGVTHYANPEIIADFDRHLIELLKAVDCDKYELYLSPRENFRHRNPLGYKANRKNLRTTQGIDDLKEYVEFVHAQPITPDIEADDVVVYLKRKYPDRYVLAAMDKDVLYQCAGKHYNYHLKHRKFIDVHPQDADTYQYYQCLAGDPSDGYGGCKGVGQVAASKIIREHGHNEVELWQAIVKTYIAKGMTEDDAINTMRLASMTQWNGTEVVLFDPPVRGFDYSEKETDDVTEMFDSM